MRFMAFTFCNSYFFLILPLLSFPSCPAGGFFAPLHFHFSYFFNSYNFSFISQGCSIIYLAFLLLKLSELFLINREYGRILKINSRLTEKEYLILLFVYPKLIQGFRITLPAPDLAHIQIKQLQSISILNSVIKP